MAHGRRPPPDPARRDWLVAAVAGAGLVVAGYLTATKLTSATALFCQTGGGCDIVQSSRYAVFLGLPTAAWGAALYLVVAGLALGGLPARPWRWAFVVSVAGLSFTAYLTYLELFVIGALCGYCLAAAGIAVALVAVLLVRKPVGAGRRSSLRPGRLAALASATAVVTVAFAVAAFMADTPGIATPYQEGLARHLSASGAVMYGAYW